MSDVIDYKIHGNDMQIVEIELDPGEGVQAEAGAMMFMEGGIEMATAASGEGLFLATLTGPGKVYLQGLPLSRLADRIMAASGGGSDKGEERMGGLMGKLLGGD
ncbi:MAG: AIM24 family protein [Deltaproteobacteria bacterium]|nr:AIM24 family protein [Deltaproteobacteria bacterium]